MLKTFPLRSFIVYGNAVLAIYFTVSVLLVNMLVSKPAYLPKLIATVIMISKMESC